MLYPDTNGHSRTSSSLSDTARSELSGFFVLLLIFGLISLLINNCLQEARATIEAKEAKANEYCATLLNNNKILKIECESLRDGLELQKKAC